MHTQMNATRHQVNDHCNNGNLTMITVVFIARLQAALQDIEARLTAQLKAKLLTLLGHEYTKRSGMKKGGGGRRRD